MAMPNLDKIQEHKLKLFSGNANIPLAEAISHYLAVKLSNCPVTRYPDGEIKIDLNENVRGYDCFVVQPTCSPVNDHLMELLMLIDTLRRAAAGRITAVIPYYGYARQDRKATPRQPISAKLVADLLKKAGVHRILTLDLHSSQIQGFFNVPVDNLHPDPVMLSFIREKHHLHQQQLVIVAAHAGGAKRARRISRKLDIGFALVDKRRTQDKDHTYQLMNIVGEVTDYVIIVDDMIDTGRSIAAAAKAIKEKGAKKIYVCATHAVFSQECLKTLTESDIDQVVVTNTIPHKDLKARCPKVMVLSVSPLLGEAIRRSHNEESVSSLFRY